jgi:hypothetical protein
VHHSSTQAAATEICTLLASPATSLASSPTPPSGIPAFFCLAAASLLFHRTAQQLQRLTQQVASSVNSFSRQLKQSAFCPDGCADGFCQQDSTSGALRCAKCVSNLIVNGEGTCSK